MSTKKKTASEAYLRELDAILDKARGAATNEELLQILKPIDEEVRSAFQGDIMDEDWNPGAQEKIAITIAEARRIRKLIWKIRSSQSSP